MNTVGLRPKSFANQSASLGCVRGVALLPRISLAGVISESFSAVVACRASPKRSRHKNAAEFGIQVFGLVLSRSTGCALYPRRACAVVAQQIVAAVRGTHKVLGRGRPSHLLAAGAVRPRADKSARGR